MKDSFFCPKVDVFFFFINLLFPFEVVNICVKCLFNNLNFTFSVYLGWVESHLPMRKRGTWWNSGCITEFRWKRLLSLFTKRVCVKGPSKIMQKGTKMVIAYTFIQLLLTLLFCFVYGHSKMRLLYASVPQPFQLYRCFSRLGIWAQSWSFHVRVKNLIGFWLMSDRKSCPKATNVFLILKVLAQPDWVQRHIWGRYKLSRIFQESFIRFFLIFA